MTREQQIAAEVAARYGVPVQDAAVRVLAPGESAFSYPVWDGKVNQLRYPDADARKIAAKNAPYIRARKSPAMVAAIVERRAGVAKLHAEGLWMAEIARRLDCANATVQQDHEALGLVPHTPPASAFKRNAVVPDQVLKRNARIAELAAQGLGATAIGREVGFDRHTVVVVARKLGITLAGAGSSAVTGETALRRAEVARLVAQGLPVQDIATALSVPYRTAWRDVDVLGLTAAKRVPSLRVPGVAKAAKQELILARRAEVQRLVEAGHSVVEIARLLGLSQRLVSHDVKAMGLRPVSGATMAQARAEQQAMATRRRNERRETVADLYQQGMVTDAIAKKIGAHVTTVRKDLRALGIVVLSAQECLLRAQAARAQSVEAASEARDSTVRALAAEGLTPNQIADRMGLSPVTVRRRLSRLGLPVARVDAERLQRREKVAALRARGATLEEMSAALGVSLYTITMDLRAVGMVRNAKAGIAARRNEVARMRAEGASIRQMAEALGVSHMTISVDIAALGLAGSSAFNAKVAA